MVFWDCFRRSRGYQPIDTSVTGFGVRHVQCFLVFCGLAVAYSLRVNLSVAIVAMTDKNATNPDFEEFDWDERTKSYLLSSFFWGYIVTQVPGGYLSHTYGAKYTFFFGIFLCSCLATLTPLFAQIGNWPLLLVLRAAQGLCQGMIFPSTHTFLSKWVPVEERGSLVSHCYCGAQFGTVVMLSVSGFIASSRLGWPSIFYISGFVGIVWSFIWLFYCASTPAEHPTISMQERRYIESMSNVRRSSDAGRQSPTPVHGQKVPWAKIFKSPPFLTLLIVHCANNWGFWTLLTEIPSFMKNILGMDIRKNGPLSALPYLAMWLLTYVFIALSDFFNRRNMMTISFSRKFFNTLGLWLPMLALLGLGYISSGGDNAKIAIALLTIAVGLNAATYLGFQVNHIDISPNFAGALMGITNCAANIISIIAPLVVGVIVTDITNALQWRIVFFLTAGFYFFGNLLFITCGKMTPQPWNVTDAVAAGNNDRTQNERNNDDESTPLFAESI